MGRPSWRRRKFFIKKEFQGKFIATYALAVVGLALVTTFILNQWLHRIVDDQLYSSHMKIQRTGELFLEPLIRTNLISMAAITCVVLGFSVIVFRRLNNHFNAMDHCFNSMGVGDYCLPPQPSSQIVEINNLIMMANDSQNMYRDKLSQVLEALGEIDKGCHGEGDLVLLQSGQNRLHAVVQQVKLPEGN